VTGAGPDGRSSLESVRDIDRSGVVELWECAEWPPTVLPTTGAEFFPNAPAPGVLQWKVATFPAGQIFPPHFTASVDLDVVVSGSVTMVLADGDHELGPGDCVVMRGVGHGWIPGPDGVTMLIARAGTDRRTTGASS
jgi:quercetin dioxygenase-like cupin family protein